MVTFGPEYTEPDETRSNGPDWSCYNIINQTNGQVIGKGCWRNYQNKMQGKYIAFAYSGRIFVHGGSGNYEESECATPGNQKKVEVNRDGAIPDSYSKPYFNSNCQ